MHLSQVKKKVGKNCNNIRTKMLSRPTENMAAVKKNKNLTVLNCVQTFKKLYIHIYIYIIYMT